MADNNNIPNINNNAVDDKPGITVPQVSIIPPIKNIIQSIKLFFTFCYFFNFISR